MFVRAPHPFGWEGIDHYHDLALSLARGDGFPTTDVPWGYAFFVALFYSVFGGRPWIPLLAQVLLNGTIPLMLYHLVRRELGERTAVVAAVLAGVFSFNTVYASTLSSDSVCTVLVLAGLLIFRRALSTGRTVLFAASGLFAGIAPQFRPNLLALPVVLVLVALTLEANARRHVAALVLYLALAVAAILPWTVRNYRLTGELMPTSTHGAIQLWYGTLQIGAYLDSRAHNPRSIFDASSFDYTSLGERPITITADRPACPPPSSELAMRYWTDRDRVIRIAAVATDPRADPVEFTVPGQPVPTTVYYDFLSVAHDRRSSAGSPADAAGGPFVVFVDDRHLADLDRHDDLLDLFDLVRAIRAAAWREGATSASEADVRKLVSALRRAKGGVDANADPVREIRVDERSATLVLADGSMFSVPRQWQGLSTDVSATEGLAAALWSARVTRAALARESHGCGEVRRVRINEEFYRQEPHMMRRYMALALDNIRRDPAAFALASLYRIGRLFVIVGTTDRHTAYQFSASGFVYAAATAASAAYAILGIIGVVLALRHSVRAWLLLTPIVYVPATICFVLTNMRYTVTIQPFVFAFVAFALVAFIDRDATSPARLR